MTPYSALAGGRLAKHKGQMTKRLAEDSYARLKYGGTETEDQKIIDRVAALAAQRGVSMTEVSLAWAFGQDHSAGGRRYQTIPDRRRGQGCGAAVDPGGNLLFGSAVCTACAGRGNGAEYRGFCQETACLVYRRTKNLKGGRVKWIE